MQIGQVIERPAGGIDDVAAAVVPPVLLDAKALRRSRNDLPESGGAAMRIGKRIVGALDNGQQGEIQRQATRFDFSSDIRQVTLCPGKHAIEIVGVAQEPAELRLDAAVNNSGKFESATQPGQQVLRGLPMQRVDIGSLPDRVCMRNTRDLEHR